MYAVPSAFGFTFLSCAKCACTLNPVRSHVGVCSSQRTRADSYIDEDSKQQKKAFYIFLLSLLVAVIKSHDRSNVWEKGCIVAHGFGVQSIVVGESRQQESEAT